MNAEPMTVRIRRYQPSDRDAILSLVARFSEFDLPEWRSTDEIDRANRAFLERALKEPEPGSAIFIAEQEQGALTGFVHLQTHTDHFSGEKHGYISDLAVAREYEGRGVGRMLLEAAEEWARTGGYRLLTLYVFAGNMRARHVYEKHGFAQELIKYVKVIDPM